MEKNKKYANKYTYGNVAYDLQPEIITSNEDKKRRKVNSKNKLKIKLRIMSTIFIICIFSVLTLVRAVSIVQLTGNIKAAKTQISENQNISDDLNMQISEIDNITNIGNTAQTKYGMVFPDSKDIVYVDVKPLTLVAQKQQNTNTPAVQFIQRLLGLKY